MEAVVHEGATLKVGSWRLAVGGGWRLAVGGGWRLAVGGWRLGTLRHSRRPVPFRLCGLLVLVEVLRGGLGGGGGVGGAGTGAPLPPMAAFLPPGRRRGSQGPEGALYHVPQGSATNEGTKAAFRGPGGPHRCPPNRRQTVTCPDPR